MRCPCITQSKYASENVQKYDSYMFSNITKSSIYHCIWQNAPQSQNVVTWLYEHFLMFLLKDVWISQAYMILEPTYTQCKHIRNVNIYVPTSANHAYTIDYDKTHPRVRM